MNVEETTHPKKLMAKQHANNCVAPRRNEQVLFEDAFNTTILRVAFNVKR